MITPNVWAEVVFHHGYRGKVVDFVYKYSSGPQSGALPKAVVLKFLALDEHVVTFLPGFPNNVSITTIKTEWFDNDNTLI